MAAEPIKIGAVLSLTGGAATLDESSTGLVPLIVAEIFRIVRMLRDSGVTILLVEQNARAALSIADHAYVMETGRITLEGPGGICFATTMSARPILVFDGPPRHPGDG